VSESHPSLSALLAVTRQLAALHLELGIPASYALDRKLQPQLEARESDLVTIGLNEQRPVRLVTDAAAAWRRMRHAAAAQQIPLVPLSGFRSIPRQAEIIRGKLAAGHALPDILRYIAAPGFSEHHTGRAVDIGAPEHLDLDEDFARTPAFRWLERHAGDFGFRLSYPRDNPHGIGYEPWHWCWHASASG
jgi:D-alanyl-D-alanine carboxypeptidase